MNYTSVKPVLDAAVHDVRHCGEMQFSWRLSKNVQNMAIRFSFFCISELYFMQFTSMFKKTIDLAFINCSSMIVRKFIQQYSRLT